MRISKAAYISIFGMCYGRVDLRQNTTNGQIYVLEINSGAGIGYNRVAESILNNDGLSVGDFFQTLNFVSKSSKLLVNN